MCGRESDRDGRERCWNERKKEKTSLKRGSQVLSCLSAVAFTEWWKAGRTTIASFSRQPADVEWSRP